ncbi:hypothetical protein L1987_07745 [Smallanthus sonchifolius]|uniref:Uncharacterized protein n=1 Tax=Smallanthus sonchifolius TaxID=185202 RepID=A0ACB9JJ90_9ASTR|nr:hypothetical protein L1987_07745 [Smallanthus sonchifolius]
MTGVRRRVGDVPIGLGLNPSEEGATEVGLPSQLHGGDTPVLDTEMEGGMEPPNPASPQVKDNTYVEEVVSDHPLESTPSPGLETPCGAFAATPEITKPRGPNVDEDGFTTVSRRKKIGPIKVQGRNQKPIKFKVVSQQNVHGQPSGRQGPAGPKGKQLGDRGGKNQQHLSTNSANCSKHINTDTSNPFSVLHIPKSIKFNKLIEAQDDLYPPDQSLKDGMDVDMLHSMNGQTEDSQPNPKSVGDHFRENDSMVCQLNREHIEGVRVLPASVISSPKLGGCLPTSSFLPGGKSYGISDDKKRAIADRLKSTGSISMDIADQWCPGQWDFFNDHCTLMGLDPDYCIEDVESDDENGTAQFFAAQMKVGMPKVPLLVRGGEIDYLMFLIGSGQWPTWNTSLRVKRTAWPNSKFKSRPSDVEYMGLHGGPTSGSVSAKTLIAYWAVMMAHHSFVFCVWKPNFEVKPKNLILTHIDGPMYGLYIGLCDSWGDEKWISLQLMERGDTCPDHIRDICNLLRPQPDNNDNGSCNGVASNMVDELITGEYSQNLHVQSADNQQDPPTRVKPRKPLISVVETSNRFNLLDEEGNIIEENGENTVEGITDDGIPKSLNMGWIKRQERMLNSRYASLVTQEQRFEAKKYVMDKLVPIQSVLSGWPIYLLEYFRLLCNLHNFGEGYMAAASESEYLAEHGTNGENNNGTPMEEVESDTVPWHL